MTNQKIFIIGLPRTATTSTCSALLDLGYRVAHTAYTRECFDNAQVIADTPVFNDYPRLDKAYPGSKFIYLHRERSLWLPSIRQLLQRMYVNISNPDGGFNCHLKRCFSETFSPFTLENIENVDFLSLCYARHQSAVERYFKHRPNDLLTIDISRDGSYQKLLDFLEIETTQGEFAKLNVGAKVTAWNKLRHPNKVESTRCGRIDKNLGY